VSSVIKPPFKRPPVSRTPIFISFNHNPRDTWFSEHIEGELNKAPELQGVRVLSKPLYTLTFDKEIDRRIGEVDGVIVLWSKEAAESYWVNYEAYAASAAQKPLVLVEYPSVAAPDWWVKHRHGIRLVGPDLADSSKRYLPRRIGGLDAAKRFDENLLRPALDFGRQVRAGEAISIPVPKPNPRAFKNGPPP
jgi:hypothetical protein